MGVCQSGVPLWLCVKLLEFWLLWGREERMKGGRDGERETADLFLYVLETNE